MSTKPIKKRKARTPKQRVLSQWPSAFSEWVPGWSMWRIVGCHAGHTTGHTAAQAWRHAANS